MTGYGGYTVPAYSLEEARKKVMDRAIEFAQKEKEEEKCIKLS